jgi:prephenate dehydrogenase
MAAAAGPETGFRRVAVLGTGLVGGSLGLAVRKYVKDACVVGWDKKDVLRQAEALGAVHESAADLSHALTGADLVYLALPIGLTLELLPEIARRADPRALVTDACSTKTKLCRMAGECFRGAARFLGGHPMAGREVSGVAHADAELFRGAKYALIREAGNSGNAQTAGANPGAAPGTHDPRVAGFVALLESLGAQPVWLDAETHDWAAAIVSHLPQLISVALAAVAREETDETGLPLLLAGSGLRDLLRLAGSPYQIWRDIALTNTDNIAYALDQMAQAIEHLRMLLTSRELEHEFVAANELYKMLRELQ